MKKIFLTAALTLILAGAFAQQWEPLFNGKNLKGWKVLNGKAEFYVQDGQIVGVSQTGQPNTFLATTKNYSDFILEFEFMCDDALNSGVQFRSLSIKKQNNGRVHGYQYEIDPAPRAWSGGIYDEARRGWLYPLTYNHPAQTAYKNNEWNSSRIEASGSSIRTWLNGVECSALIEDMTMEGFIALQVHGIGKNTALEGKQIRWRNIRICTENVAEYLSPANKNVTEINCIPNAISEREAADGFRLLWDGETTDGWRGARLDGFPEKGWSIQDGALMVEKADGAEADNGGDIVTVKSYKNFILKVDFKIDKGANSGIKYFVKPDMNKGEGSAIGCEFQILDDQNHPDAKQGVGGNRTLGSLYDLIPAKDKSEAYYRAGSFNTAMVVVHGNHVEHWLNGVKIVEYERNNQMWDALVDYSKYRDWADFGNHSEGHILLQDHGDKVSFRNIKIKELKCAKCSAE